MQPLDPQRRAGLEQTMERWERNTMLEAIGYRRVDLGRGWAKAELPYRTDLSQVAGIFHAGALITLADTCATWACLTLLCDERGEIEGHSPYTIQASANLVGNVSSGKAVAESTVTHAGRTTHVTQTRVTSGDGKLLLLLTTTHLIASEGSQASPVPRR